MDQWIKLVAELDLSTTVVDAATPPTVNMLITPNEL
jgi:hypothetical protein